MKILPARVYPGEHSYKTLAYEADLFALEDENPLWTDIKPKLAAAYLLGVGSALVVVLAAFLIRAVMFPFGG